MIARALGVGIVTWPCWDDAEPIGVVELGTAASQPSSCCDRSCPLSVYQEPAWVGLRVAMLMMRFKQAKASSSFSVFPVPLCLEMMGGRRSGVAIVG